MTTSSDGSPDLQEDAILEIVLVTMFAIHSVDQRLALVVGLQAEGQGPMAVPLHLRLEESLNLENRGLH